MLPLIQSSAGPDRSPKKVNLHLRVNRDRPWGPLEGLKNGLPAIPEADIAPQITYITPQQILPL
jgi:hypothetical protein